MPNSIRIKTELRFYAFKTLIVCMFFYDTLLNYATAVFNKLPIIKLIGNYIVPFTVVILFFLCVFYTRNIKFYFSDFFIICFILVSLLVSYAFFPNNQAFFNMYNLKNVFIKAIPFLLLGSNFDTSESTYKLLVRLSCFAILVNVLYLSIYVKTNYVDDNMHWAYLLLPHVLMVISGFIVAENNKFKVIRISITIIGVLYVVSMGSRGPILIIIIYSGVLLFLNLLNKHRKAAVATLIIVSIIAFIIFSGAYLSLINLLHNFLSNIGLSVRAVDLLIRGEYISYTSGRDVIYKILWAKIIENPIIGYGVFGEWQYVGYSAHNLYFEICMHYGLFLGTTLSFIYIRTVARGYLLSSNNVAKNIILLYAVFTIVRGIFGADYFSDYFFFLLGLSIQQIRLSKSITTTHKYEKINSELKW